MTRTALPAHAVRPPHARQPARRAAPDGRERQDDAFYGISDLHAMTTTHDPRLLRSRTPTRRRPCSSPLGLDRATLFRQSQVPAHAQLAYLLECTATPAS